MSLNFIQTLLVLIVIGVSLFYLYLRRNYAYWKNRGVPYEEPNILLGNLSFIMRKSVWEYFLELRQKYSTKDYIGIFLGWKPTLVVQTPELARKILTKDFDYFQNRLIRSSYSSDPLGSLTLTSFKNPTWSNMRHELSPMFTSLRLKLVTELMNGNATELVQKIQRDHIDNKEAVNLKELFSMYTSDTVGSTVFGIKVSALNDINSPLWYITSHMVKWTFWRGLEFSIIFFTPALAALLRLKLFSQPATEYIKKLFWDVVKERKQAGQTNDKDLVNHLLKLKDNLKLPADSGTQLADDLMLAQAAIFILGSIETSSTTLSYCMHELAHHPELQEKLGEEISDAIKRKGKEILEYDDLLELKYLTACILETLRKYPPVPHLDRECTATYRLDERVTVEKGTPVFVNVMALHYDPKVFPNPEQWNPDRMSNVAESDNLQFSFVPFGDGPHFCIGKRYGVIQVRAALAQMLSKYRVEPDPNEPYLVKPDPYSVMLSPLSGGRVKFVLR
uniref:unspecific monooxygenase n=1 Tax=Operophtera brumata TaxID=104452 RepID=A0A2Z6JKK7_OPEBR|nr:TPA_inf: cytochrome P450 CYP332A39 [Operophtera brumata]